MLREHNWIFQEALESLKVFMEDQEGKISSILLHLLFIQIFLFIIVIYLICPSSLSSHTSFSNS